MNTFINNLKQRIDQVGGNCISNTDIIFFSIKDLIEYEDKLCPIFELKNVRCIPITEFIIIHWTDIDKGLADIYNIYEDYIELILKLKYPNKKDQFDLIKVIK